MKALLFYLLMPFDITIPDPDCGIANAASPIGDFFTGSLLGLAFKFGPWFVVALLAILVFTYKTKFGKFIMAMAIASFVALLIIGVITGHPGAFFQGVKGC